VAALRDPPLAHELERAQRLRHEAAVLRLEIRGRLRELRAALEVRRATLGELEARQERVRSLQESLGSWPYWAPPDAALWRVLVPRDGEKP
jgi:hypothetical protein